MEKRMTLRRAAALLCLAALAAGSGAHALSPEKKGVTCGPPVLVVSGKQERGQYWERGFEAVYKTLFSNLHGPNSFFQTRYAYPSPMFRGVYLWDTAFIAQVWKPWDVLTAQDVNRAVLDHGQDGRLQHFTSQYSKSGNTQPPVMAWSVWENYLWSNDRDYLARAWPALRDYNKWLYSNRRLPSGLFFWIHSYESGIDNSPRFGSADESVAVDVANIGAIDLCSYMVKQNQVLALMARELGMPDKADQYDKQARELKALINDLMWDEESGYFYDRDERTGELVKIRTIASLFPLFAGVPDKERALIIRDHVMDPAEFNTPFPLPSVARDDPYFEKDCWRGPIWVNTAYLVILGMERYGFHREAAELSFKVVDGVYRNYKNTGKLVEFYDPERFDYRELNRKKGNLYKLITLGNKPRPNFVGWTGLCNTLIIEHLMGLKKDRGRTRLEPRFPAEAEGMHLLLKLGGDISEIDMEVGPGGRVTGKAVGKTTGVLDFDLDFGEREDL